MSHRGLIVSIITALCLCGTQASAQGENANEGADREETIPGRTVVIELPPAGKRLRLPLDGMKHAVLWFDEPVVRVAGKPQGVLARPVRGQSRRVDLWPDALRSTVPKEAVKPPGGNVSIELDDRTIMFDLYEPGDLDQAIELVTVRSVPGKVEVLEQKVKEAKDEATNARAGEARAKREAREARQEAETTEARARKEVGSARADARRANADAAKARAEAKEARAEAKEARAEAKEARAEAKEARAEAKEARATATEALAQATTAKQGREKARHQLLVAAARELRSESVQRLRPERGSATRISRGRLYAEFKQADWTDDHFLFNAELGVPSGRPFSFVDGDVIARSGRVLETRVIHPDAPENPEGDIVTTVYPATPRQITFAVTVPPDESVEGLTLELTEHNSKSPPLRFVVPTYKDAVVPIMWPISDEEEQRMRWARQVVVGPRVALGGCWLTSGQEGETELDATRCTAVGAYIAKGFHEYVALGLDVLGSWSGDVQFDGEPDDLTRNATLFRALAFGDARFSGGKVVPYLRLGTGVQVIRYDGSAEASTDIVLTYAVGGGVLYRFGENISAGLTVLYNQSTDEMFRSLDAGMHLSYGWNP